MILTIMILFIAVFSACARNLPVKWEELVASDWEGPAFRGNAPSGSFELGKLITDHYVETIVR